MARIYRFCRAGLLPWEAGAKAVYILSRVSHEIEGSDLERRLAAVEAGQARDPDIIETKDWR